MIEVDRRFVLTFVFVCAYNEIVDGGTVSVVSVQDHSCRLNLLGEAQPSDCTSIDTLGLGRLFHFRKSRRKGVIRMKKSAKEKGEKELKEKFLAELNSAMAKVDALSIAGQCEHDAIAEMHIQILLSEIENSLDQIYYVAEQLHVI